MSCRRSVVNAEAIIAVMGKGIYAGYESYLDLATAVSGSGPAYVFLFMEAFIDAARAIGMPEAMAKNAGISDAYGFCGIRPDIRQRPG